LTDSLIWASQHLFDQRKENCNCDEAKTEASSTSAAALYHNTLDDEQRRKIAILSNTLSNMFIPSDKENLLASTVPELKADPIFSLEQIIGAYICGECDDNTRQNTARSLDVIRQRVPEATGLLADTLFSIIKAKGSQPNVSAESAITISRFLEQGYLSPKDLQFIVGNIEENASLLISVLSTASMTSAFSSKEDDPLESLYILAAASKTVQRKMAKRRCTILAIARRLASLDHWTRVSALDFCQRLFADGESVDSLCCVGKGKNLDILVNGLIKLVFHDTVVQNQLTAVSILSQIQALNSQVKKILECMKWLAFKSTSRDSIIASTNSYCQCVRRCEDLDIEHLKAVVEFTALAQKEVRHEALVTIELQMNARNTISLLKDSDLIDNCHRIILEGPDQDCTIAFDIVRQAARSRSCHAQLCSHPAFLETVVQFVAKKETPDPYAMEILLAILSGEDNASAFQKISDLLPWLVSFVNTVGTDDDVKEQLVAVIMRLSLVSYKQREE
jgi:hypothetical protein